MDHNLEKLFALVEDREPSPDFLARVNLAVDRAERRHLFIRAAGFITMALVSIGALIPSWYELQSEIAQSGFVKFVSLLTSDFNLVTTYWKEFSMSIIQSAPIFGITAVLASTLLLLISLRFVARDLSELPLHRPRLNVAVNKN